MPHLKRVLPEHVDAWKRVRLEALRDTPMAFGSTYAREEQFSREDWIRRVRAMTGDSSIGYLAWEDGVAVGMIRGSCEPEAPGRVDVTSVWVRPGHRGMGVGVLLTEAIVTWARDRGAERVQLSVTNNNSGAIALYERCGFRKTGVTQAYPNDSALFEFEMVLNLVT